MLTFDNEAPNQESRDSNHCYQVMWVDIEEMFTIIIAHRHFGYPV
jgi:hypothetical protein